jgi:hypothetical protein
MAQIGGDAGGRHASHITSPQLLHAKPAGGPGGEKQGLASPSPLGTGSGHAQQYVRLLASEQSAAVEHSSSN